MKKQLLCFFFLLFGGLHIALAQSRRITGKITSASDNYPLAGVSVVVQNTTIGTISNADGLYAIEVPEDARTLRFNYIGYISQTISLKDEREINVQLSEDVNSLDEVVVSAGGILRAPREQGYATTQITNTELTKGKSPTIAGGLTAKVPGLQVNAISSGVNPNYRLILRGNRSLLGNNTALIVVDNAVVNSDFLNNINPEDVEDIQVLNGAAGAAAYGAEGSNGVLIVTTKKGKKGSAVIKVVNTTTFEDISFFPKLQDRFGAGSTADAQIYDPIENQQYGPGFDGAERPIGAPLENGDQQYGSYTARNDRYDFWDTGINNQTDLSISSGSEKSTSYIAGQYLTAKGTTPGDKYTRISGRFNGTREILPSLSVDYTANFVHNQSDITYATSSIYTQLTQTPANVPLLGYQDWVNNPYATPDGWYNPWYRNPYWTADNYRADGKNDYITAKLELKYTPTKWLTFTYRPSISNRYYFYKYYTPKFTYSDYSIDQGKTNLAGSVGDTEFHTSRFNQDLQATFKHEIKDFTFNLTLTGSSIDRTYKNVNVAAAGLVIPGLNNIGNRSIEADANEENTHSRTYALWGDFLAGYKNYLFLHITGRNDWTSLLSKANRSYFYPAVDLSFIASDAIASLQESSVVNYLKIRGGASRTGFVNLDPYSLEATFSSVTGFSRGTFFSLDSRLVSPDLKPEITKGYEFGTDFRLWDERIDGTFTYYHTNTSDQAINAGIPVSTGYSSFLFNTGEVTNNGIETALHITPLRSADWELTFGGNYTHNTNKLKSLYPGLDRISINGSSVIYAEVGKEINQIVVSDYARDPQGRVIVDVNTGYPSAAAVSQNLGNTIPKHRLGLDLNVRWKDFSLSSLFEYRGGYNYAAIDLGSSLDFGGSSARSAYYNRERFVFPNSSYLDPTTGEYVANTNITVSDGGSGFWTSGAYNRSISSNYVYSGNYWKWREASLSYRVPQSFLNRIKGIKAAVISVQGRNLLLWVPKSNEYTDPDYSANDNNAIGVSTTGQTPPTRYFGGTISLTF